MLLSYKADIFKVKEKIALYEMKYAGNFIEFEATLKAGTNEDFEKWDDYMEWKAYEKSLISILNTINEISRGHFKIA
jgi:hypothetical protein